MAEGTLELGEQIGRLVPPEARDRAIFEAVVGQGLSQGVVAKAYGLSQPRVSQIVAEVRAWLAVATDEEAGELPAEQQLRYGQRVVRMRLEGLLGITMDCFHASQGMVSSQRTRDSDKGCVVEKTLKSSFGDLKYLTHYRSVVLAIARLNGVNVAPRHQPARLPEAPAMAAAPAAVQPAKAAAPPPPAATPRSGDLSAALQEILDRVPPAASEPQASRGPATTCDATEKRKTPPDERAAEQKNAYKQARRQAFLRGAAPPAGAVAS